MEASHMHPALPNPEVMGWKIEDTRVELIIKSFLPVLESCREVIACPS